VKVKVLELIKPLNCLKLFFRFFPPLLSAYLFVSPVALTKEAFAQAIKSDRALLNESRFKAPAGWQWGYLTNQDGARLRFGYARASKPRAVIVFVPGFTGCAEEFFETFKDFLNRGYDVFEMDWRGNGGSERYFSDNHDKIHSLGVDRDDRDLHQFISLVSQKKIGLPIFLIAHSYGGLVALMFLHDHPGLVERAVLSSPACSFPKIPPWLVQPVAELICGLGFANDYAFDQADYPHLEPKLLNAKMHTHDPERLRLPDALFNIHPELRVGGATWGFIDNFTGAVLQVTGPQYLASIKTPILICSGTDDRICYHEPHVLVARQLPSARLLTIYGGRHELMREDDDRRKLWLKYVFAFLKE
jgi:lysophospholipase